jgi:hypothetical protein
MCLTLPGILVSNTSDIWPVLGHADAQLATTLQYEHFKAEEHENKLEIIPWRFKVDTTLYNASSRIFYFEMILLSAAEILAPEYTLRTVRVMNVICVTSIPVVIRLMVLARRGGVYEEYMVYPNTA